MTKVLLITTSIEELIIGSINKYDKVGMKTKDDTDGYPLGLAYLHSYLESKNFQVETLFLNNYTYDECFNKTIEKINSFKPDFVAYQILTQNRISTFKLIEYLHQQCPQIKQVIGGVHTTILYQQILKKYPFLIAVIGEGEITISELLLELGKEQPNLEKIDGIAYYKNNAVAINSLRNLIGDLDILPFPKHEIFFQGKRKVAIILTTRGCPFSCSFCCLDLITRKRVRRRSIANVMAEIEWLIKNMPQLKSIWIQDDTFFVDNARVIEFCDEIIKRKIKLNFICSARFKPISEAMVKKLVEANITKIYFGLESGDETILKNCHKGITQADVINAFKLFASNKFSIYAHLIIGLPGENINSIKTTIKFVKKLQKIKYINYNDAYLLTVYPGTEVYSIAKAGGMINDDYWMTDNITPIFTLENSLEQLMAYKEMILDNISLARAYTSWRGFICQFTMIPYHIKYIFGSKNHLLAFSKNFIRFVLPKRTYKFLKNKFKNSK